MGQEQVRIHLGSSRKLSDQPNSIHVPQVQTAARVLDRGAITFGRVLSQNPLLRLWVVLYALFVHCFVYMLLHRLQRLARAEDLINLREPNELDEAKAAFVGRG